MKDLETTPPSDLTKAKEICSHEYVVKDLPHDTQIAQARKLKPSDAYYSAGWRTAEDPRIHHAISGLVMARRLTI